MSVAGGFTYVEHIEVTSLFPSGGPLAGGYSVTVHGAQFPKLNGAASGKARPAVRLRRPERPLTFPLNKLLIRKSEPVLVKSVPCALPRARPGLSAGGVRGPRSCQEELHR